MARILSHVILCFVYKTGHYNYVGYDAEKAPFLLSIVMSDQICRCILWRKVVSESAYVVVCVIIPVQLIGQ